MIFFLLLNILFFNIEIFSADQRTSFLTPEGTISENRNNEIEISLVSFAFNLAEKDRNLIYANRSLLGVGIGGTSAMIGISQFSANSLLIKRIPIIREILIKTTKEIDKEIIISYINNICAKKELKNKNLKKYISASFIFMILSGILFKYFSEQSHKRFNNNLDIVGSPETINLWKILFQIEKKELSIEDNKNFFNAVTSPEEPEQKKINNRIQFFKKIIKIKMLCEKTNQLNLTPEEKKNMNTKIANIIFYNPPQVRFI